VRSSRPGPVDLRIFAGDEQAGLVIDLKGALEHGLRKGIAAFEPHGVALAKARGVGVACQLNGAVRLHADDPHAFDREPLGAACSHRLGPNLEDLLALRLRLVEYEPPQIAEKVGGRAWLNGCRTRANRGRAFKWHM